jgi:hypothetical protein
MVARAFTGNLTEHPPVLAQTWRIDMRHAGDFGPDEAAYVWLERAWLERFGEPLVLRTDPDLVLDILSEAAARADRAAGITPGRAAPGGRG